MCTSFFSSFLWADGTWECANSITEVACIDKGNCGTNNNRETNFKISILKNDQVSVCSDNNCWQGKASTIKSGNNKLYAIEKFNWRANDNKNDAYVLGVSSNKQNLYLQGKNHTYQLQCKLMS